MNKIQHFKQITWRASLLATLLSFLAVTVALAASGGLDMTFDGDGLVTTDVNAANPGQRDVIQGIAIQPADGKIVAAGYSYLPSADSDFALTRYNTDGSLDTTFSGDGRLITKFGGESSADDIAVQPNGKIVAAGYKCVNEICDTALARYNANGKLDLTFSGNGKKTTDFGGGDNGAQSLMIQPDGKIVLAGWMWNGTDYDFAVYRYNANGSLDSTFSGDGMVRFGFGAGRHDSATDLAIQNDGKIVVVGYTSDLNYDEGNFAVARLNPNGKLDTTFSRDGRQSTNFGANDMVFATALQSDGKIVVLGRKYTATTPTSFALARYNTNGGLDITFNGTGKKAFSFMPGASSYASDLIIQPDGKIVIAGAIDTYDFAVARLNSGGSLDKTFSGDGKATVDFGGDEFGYAIALQPSDGQYVIGGNTYDNTRSDFALARVLP